MFQDERGKEQNWMRSYRSCIVKIKTIDVATTPRAALFNEKHLMSVGNSEVVSKVVEVSNRSLQLVPYLRFLIFASLSTIVN